jgi:hypothetical protein
VLTSTANLIHLNKKLNDSDKGSAEFQNTKNRTQVLGLQNINHSTVHSQTWEENMQSHLKRIKVVLKHGRPILINIHI